MRSPALGATVWLVLALSPPAAAQHPLELPLLPPFQQVEAAWKGFWDAVILGDLGGARRYVHSHRQHLFPGRLTVQEMREMAGEMAHCRLDPTPVPLGEDVLYRVVCQHGSETAETQIGVRRDMDGVWRLSVL